MCVRQGDGAASRREGTRRGTERCWPGRSGWFHRGDTRAVQSRTEIACTHVHKHPHFTHAHTPPTLTHSQHSAGAHAYSRLTKIQTHWNLTHFFLHTHTHTVSRLCPQPHARVHTRAHTHCLGAFILPTREHRPPHPIKGSRQACEGRARAARRAQARGWGPREKEVPGPSPCPHPEPK